MRITEQAESVLRMLISKYKTDCGTGKKQTKSCGWKLQSANKRNRKYLNNACSISPQTRFWFKVEHEILVLEQGASACAA